ncbi:DUF3006 domain-containing protein [Aneurinibacillus tyrosinisolvens]|uniref:DUF3006 domain-containing protein n=1 Tax=Aneurinibacillus tyrosinisolvens TaxID=1443435 RepID=UPI00063F069C|nr:DUF3006 domain-containing protein [Aneurinibacillus tyrosinisolvens]
MMKGIVDRFEGEIVVVEIEGKTHDFPKSLFPSEVKPGDIVVMDGKHISIDKKEMEERKKNINKLMDELFED